VSDSKRWDIVSDSKRWDIECPHCKHKQEVCHDDGFGYEEDVLHEVECCGCGKEYGFLTSIYFSYEAQCIEHDLIDSVLHEGWQHCTRCGYFGKKQEGQDDE